MFIEASDKTMRGEYTNVNLDYVKSYNIENGHKFENKTAPPPTNGSQYVVYLFGKSGSISDSNCLLPPTHLTTGATNLFFIMFVLFNLIYFANIFIQYITNV